MQNESLLNNSELILNEDQSIYHLKLKNGELASRVITVGDPERVSAVSQHFDEIYLTKRSREFVTVTGRVGTTDLSVISTGIGTDNIDIVFNELFLVNAYDLATRTLLANPPTLQVLRLGTSGAIQKDVSIDSLLISQSALGFDGLLPFYKNDFAQPDLGLEKLPRPFWVPASASMLKQFRALTPHQGITVTAAGFYAPQGRKIAAPPTYGDFIERLAAVRLEGQRLTNLEMETAGIYGLGKLLGMETLSISAILANRISGAFSKKPQQIVETMIAEALEIFSAPR
jgi:uridine phosphorylase